MKDIYILGIETSCDETSVSIVKNGEEEISTVVLSQIDIHKKFGGVVPEIASRSHVENITIVIEEAITKSGMKIEDMDAIAVTYGPGLAGSLIVGVETAKTLAMIYHKPLIAVHHIAGHIYANRLVSPLNFPLIALVISGGHTEIVYMEKDYSFKKIGGTLDDSVGETYDKVARVMNVPYPGGPVLDKYAKMGKHTYNLPVPMDDDSYDFSFSGLKSAVLNYLNGQKMKNKEIVVEDVAASFQEAVVEVLATKAVKAALEKNYKTIALSGGVAANSALREKISEMAKEHNIEIKYPSLSLCTDNAAMIGCAGYYNFINGKRDDMSLNAVPNLKIDVI